MTHPENPALHGKDWPFPSWLDGAVVLGGGPPLQPVSYLGHDSEWLVARGHTHPRLFVAQAMVRWAQDTNVADTIEKFDLSGGSWSDSPLEDWAGRVEHRWAVADMVDGEESIRWEDFETRRPITKDEPLAFPITILDLEV